MNQQPEVVSGFRHLDEARAWAKAKTLQQPHLVCEAVQHGDKPVVIVRYVANVKADES